MNTRWSIYDPETGDFTGKQISGPSEGFIETHITGGYSAIVGSHDHLTMQVVDGVVVERAQALERPTTPGDVMQQIYDLEASQLRPMRELMLDSTDAAAITKLGDIDSQIVDLRDQLAMAKVEAVASPEPKTPP